MIDLPQLPAHADEHLASLDRVGLIDLMIRDEDRVPRNVIDECGVAPVPRDGRGLKLGKGQTKTPVNPSSARPSGQARIETTRRIGKKVATLVAPALPAGEN